MAGVFRRKWAVQRYKRKRFVPTAPVGSGAPTLSAPTVINITSTTAQPRVTVTFP